MTSNIGSDAIQQATLSGISQSQWDELKKTLMETLKTVFRPEFLNRVDDIIVFHALKKEQVQQITDLMLGDLKRLVRAQGLELEISEEVRNRLAQDGYDPQLGARPLRREIQKRLENKLSTVLLTGQFPPGSTIRAKLSGDDVVFETISV
jgi:ATP-dependent Clp protease ATP-binding subunit ClpA